MIYLDFLWCLNTVITQIVQNLFLLTTAVGLWCMMNTIVADALATQVARALVSWYWATLYIVDSMKLLPSPYLTREQFLRLATLWTRKSLIITNKGS